jgi:hypothetical protein
MDVGLFRDSLLEVVWRDWLKPQNNLYGFLDKDSKQATGKCPSAEIPKACRRDKTPIILPYVVLEMEVAGVFILWAFYPPAKN